MNSTNSVSQGALQAEDDAKLVDLPKSWAIVIMVIMTIVFALTVIGNIAVIVVQGFSNVLNSVINSHFLVSLSIADLLVAILVMPCALDTVNTGTWRCGEFWGKANGFGNFLFCISSIMHLMMLSIDRYMAIARPLLYPIEMTKTRALVICFVLWTYSAIWAFLPLFGVSSYECFISYIGTCKAEDWSEYGLNFVFAISVVSGTYGLALIAMVYVYFKIARVIRNQLRRSQDVSRCVPKIDDKDLNFTSKKIEHGKVAKKLNRNKGVMTLLVVTLVYLVCWSPFCIMLFIEIGTGEKVKGPYSTLAMLAGFANSCCNPVIYSIKYRRFRFAVISMLAKKNLVANFTVTNARMSSMVINERPVRRINTPEKSVSIL